MIGLETLYVIAGLYFAVIAAMSARDAANPKRWRNTSFWGLLAVAFLFGSHMPDLAVGVLVLVLALIGGFGGLGRAAASTAGPEQRAASAERLGNRIFIPALVIPFVALAGSLLFKRVVLPGIGPLVDARNVTLVSLVLGVALALAVAMPMLRARAGEPLQEARRLIDTIGWAAILPQMLASLGAVFALAGVGSAVGDVVTGVLPEGSRLAAVCAYTFGMAAFTMVMGNAFAAFPVMTAAVGLPLIVGRFGGDPAIMGAVGMLSGFCGTLMTPMAANFNMVPAALLELKDRDGVIKAQIPTALPLLLANTVLMYALVFRF